MTIVKYPAPKRRRPRDVDPPDNGESEAREALCRLAGPQSRYFLSGLDGETTFYDFLGYEPGDQ
jgi:hypothetical protein